MADSTLTFSFIAAVAPVGNATPITLTLSSADIPAGKLAVQNIIKNGGFWCDAACYSNSVTAHTLFFSASAIMSVDIT